MRPRPVLLPECTANLSIGNNFVVYEFFSSLFIDLLLQEDHFDYKLIWLFQVLFL